MASKKFNYLRLAKTAQRLIEKFGKVETINGYLPGIPDPAKPTKPVPSIGVNFQANCVFLDYQVENVDGITVKVGDMYVLVSPLDLGSLSPQLTGRITRSATSEIWNIVKIEIVQPAEMKLLYKIQVRK